MDDNIILFKPRPQKPAFKPNIPDPSELNDPATWADAEVAGLAIDAGLALNTQDPLLEQLSMSTSPELRPLLALMFAQNRALHALLERKP